jgi:protein transport protein SEC24
MPTTQNISEVFASADQLALVALFANKAVERSLSHKMEDARDAVFGKTAEILSAYRSSITAGGASASAQLAIADNLHMFPVLMLGLLKTVSVSDQLDCCLLIYSAQVGLRQSAQIPSDLRAHAQALLTSLPIDLLIPYLYPTFYSLHAMPEEVRVRSPALSMHPLTTAQAGTVGEHGVIMPRPLPLTLEKLERHGLFLIEDGQNLFLWVGRDAVPQLVLDVFGVPAYADLRGGKVRFPCYSCCAVCDANGARPSQMQLPTLDNPFSQRVTAVVQKARERRRSLYYQHLFVVKEDGDPALRAWAMSGLIQDRSDPIPGYQQFIQQLREKVGFASHRVAREKLTVSSTGQRVRVARVQKSMYPWCTALSGAVSKSTRQIWRVTIP